MTFFEYLQTHITNTSLFCGALIGITQDQYAYYSIFYILLVITSPFVLALLYIDILILYKFTIYHSNLRHNIIACAYSAASYTIIVIIQSLKFIAKDSGPVFTFFMDFLTFFISYTFSFRSLILLYERVQAIKGARSYDSQSYNHWFIVFEFANILYSFVNAANVAFEFFNTLITPLFFFLADLMAMFIFGCYSKIARKQWEEELYTKSSLGYRFQIQENLRIFWAVQTIFFILCISSILTTFMAIVANMHVAQRLDSILVFNAFVLFAIAVAASVLLFAHKSALTKIFPCFFKKNKIEVILSSEDKIRENKKITDNYFNQYETQW